jgi:membrane protein
MPSSTEDLPGPAQQVIRDADRAIGHTEIPRARHLRLRDIVRLAAQQVGPHHLPAFAGNLTYNAFLASFPFLLVLLSVLRALHATDLLSGLVAVLTASLPASSAQLFRDQIQPDVASRIPNSWLLNVVLVLGSLWAVSAVFRAVTAAMNVMYECTERRPLWARFGLSIVLSLLTACLFLSAAASILAGSRAAAALAEAVHLGPSFATIWVAVQWIILVACAFLGFALTYYVAPDVKRPIRSVSPGALGATLAWLLFTLAFAAALNQFGTVLVDPLYGWFTGLIVLLLYLYWSSLILLVGAEVNRVIEANAITPARSAPLRNDV